MYSIERGKSMQKIFIYLSKQFGFKTNPSKKVMFLSSFLRQWQALLIAI
jgi:hypothetical protein